MLLVLNDVVAHPTAKVRMFPMSDTRTRSQPWIKSRINSRVQFRRGLKYAHPTPVPSALRTRQMRQLWWTSFTSSKLHSIRLHDVLLLRRAER